MLLKHPRVYSISKLNCFVAVTVTVPSVSSSLENERDEAVSSLIVKTSYVVALSLSYDHN